MAVPTPEEISGMTMLSSVCAWAGLTDVEEQALYRALGAVGDEHPRVSSTVSDAEFGCALGAARIEGVAAGCGDVPATITQKGKMRLVGLACRKLRAPLPGPLAATDPSAQVFEGVAKLAEAVRGKKHGTRTVGMDSVVDQSDKSEGSYCLPRTSLPVTAGTTPGLAASKACLRLCHTLTTSRHRSSSRLSTRSSREAARPRSISVCSCLARTVSARGSRSRASRWVSLANWSGQRSRDQRPSRNG